MHYQLSTIFVNIRGKFCVKMGASRVIFLLKTDSGYPKDTVLTLFTLTTPGKFPRVHPSVISTVSALPHSRGPRKWSQSTVCTLEHRDTYSRVIRGVAPSQRSVHCENWQTQRGVHSFSPPRAIEGSALASQEGCACQLFNKGVHSNSKKLERCAFKMWGVVCIQTIVRGMHFTILSMHTPILVMHTPCAIRGTLVRSSGRAAASC